MPPKRPIRRGCILVIPLIFSSIARSAQEFCSAGYLTDQWRGEEAADLYGKSFQALNVFSFQYDGECRLVAASPWVQDAALKYRDDPRRPLMVDIVNEIAPGPGPCQLMTPGQMLQHFLSDPALRADRIRDIVAVSALGQGVEIDFENLLPQTLPHMTTFIRELRAALPPDKKLAAVVQPKTRTGGGAGRNVDWRGIEPYVDYLRVMAYYYSWKSSPPGPVVTYAKLAELADYMLADPDQGILREKARIVLSLYGWDWPVAPAGPGRLVTYREAMDLARAHEAPLERSAQEDTLHFQYSDQAGVRHEVWFDDFLGHSKRVQLLMNRDFPAVDLWHLNTGDPALWPWFSERVGKDCPSLEGETPGPADVALEGMDRLSVPAGRGDVRLTLRGRGFASGDAVLWQGNPYPTTLTAPDALEVTLKGSDVATPRTGNLFVSRGGRLSNAIELHVVGNPVMMSFLPPFAPSGAGFGLKLLGDGFEPSSEVQWGGNPVSVRFVSPQELLVEVPSSLVERPGAVRVGVFNPTSGSRISRMFSVLGTPAVAGPNPWSSLRHAGVGVRFFGVSEGSAIDIYTVSGERIKRVAASQDGVEWDLTDEDGGRVASGMYFYRLSDDQENRQGVLTVSR